MGKAIPPIEPNPAWDETLPDTAAIEAQRPVIEEYLHAVYGLDARPDGGWEGMQRRRGERELFASSKALDAMFKVVKCSVIEEHLHAVYGLDARPDGGWVQ